MKQYATDDDLAAEVRRRLKAGDKSLRQVADDMGVSYPFLTSFVRRAWPHAQPRLIEALGYDSRRYYRRKR